MKTLFHLQRIKAILGVGVISILLGCASLPVPETPAQRLYVLQSQYAILAETAATYIESSCADPQCVQKIQQFDRSIHNGLKQARELLNATDESTELDIRLNAVEKMIRELRTCLAQTKEQAS